MKTFTLLPVLLIMTTAVNAQLDKGQFLIGGNISFESVKNESTLGVGYKSSNFFFSPNIGYFFIPKLAAGLRTDIRVYKQKAPNSGNTQTNTSLSPFLRYYFLPRKKPVNVFIDLGYINYRTKFHNGSTPAYIEHSNGYNISAGPCIFLSEHVALEFILGFKHTKAKDIYNSRSDIFNSGLGLQVHLGRIKAWKSKRIANTIPLQAAYLASITKSDK